MDHDNSRIKEENLRLKKALRELSILNEIATAINSTQSLNRIIELIVQKCIKHLKVEQSAVMLLSKENDTNPLRTMVRKANSHIQASTPYRLDTQLTGWMLKNQKPLLINDFKNDRHFSNIKSENLMIKSLLCVPLIVKGSIIGILCAFNKRDKSGFTEDDRRLLSIIATQSAQLIENARLREEEETLIQIQKEMEMALSIQTNLLPAEKPELEGYSIAGKTIPSKTVGGDYFDFISLDNNKLAVTLGDVSGKGLPAALLMANLQATIRGLTLLDNSPATCLNQSNKLLYRSTDQYKFATLFYGIIDTDINTFRYANAGHNRPLFFRKGNKFETLETAGLVLGVLDDYHFSENEINLNSGDLLLIYSDGVIDSLNTNGEDFGEDRLIHLIEANRDRMADEIISAIVESICSFSQGCEQFDDITLVVVKKL